MNSGLKVGEVPVTVNHRVERSWLLEVNAPSVTLYFGCGGCDVGAGDAIRFSRKEDAVAMLSTLERFRFVAKGCYVVSEHHWAFPDVNT